MGSRPSKVAPVRSRSGLSFISQSSYSSGGTLQSVEDDVIDYVRNFNFDEVTTNSFRVKWDPPEDLLAASYQVRLFPPDHIKSKSLLRALPRSDYTFTRLKSSTTYTVGVIATDDYGNKGPCATGYVTTLPRPPREIRFSNDNNSEAFKVYWKHCKSRHREYEIDLSPDVGVTCATQIRNLRQASQLFKGLVPGTEYEVNIRTVVQGAKSEPLTGKIKTAPRHVCDLIFNEVTHHEMALKWKKPEGKVDSYTLELTECTKRQREPVIIEKLTRTSYIFNGLTPGRLYNCKITSNVLDASSRPQTYSQCTVPLEATGISVRGIGPEEAVITWLSSGGDVDDYDLFLTPKDGVVGETSPRGLNTNEYKFTGLIPGTTYTVGIVSNAKDKHSKRAKFVFATEPGMCGDLEFLEHERTCTSQLVKWPPAAGRMDHYVIIIRRDDKQEAAWKVENIYKPQYKLENLMPGTLYRVHVAAMRDGRESSSVDKCFGTEPKHVPSIYFPKDSCNWRQITCAWEPCVGGVDSYRVTAKSKGGVTHEAVVSSENADHTFGGLYPATVYKFTVTALSNKIESVGKSGKQITGPPQVRDLQAQAIDKRAVKVIWKPPESGADDYKIKIWSYDESDQASSLYQETSQTEFIFRALVPGSHYEVEVIPIAHKVIGKPSTAKTYTKPGDVLNVYVPANAVTMDTIMVQWWGVEGNCKDVEIILTRLRKNGDPIEEQSPIVIKQEKIAPNDGGSSSYTFCDLDSDTVYGIRLRAVGDAGFGEDAVITQPTLAPPFEQTLPDVANPSKADVVLSTMQKEPSVPLRGDIPDIPVVEATSEVISPIEFNETKESAQTVYEKTSSPGSAIVAQGTWKNVDDNHTEHAASALTFKESNTAVIDATLKESIVKDDSVDATRGVVEEIQHESQGLITEKKEKAIHNDNDAPNHEISSSVFDVDTLTSTPTNDAGSCPERVETQQVGNEEAAAVVEKDSPKLSSEAMEDENADQPHTEDIAKVEKPNSQKPAAVGLFPQIENETTSTGEDGVTTLCDTQKTETSEEIHGVVTTSPVPKDKPFNPGHVDVEKGKMDGPLSNVIPAANDAEELHSTDHVCSSGDELTHGAKTNGVSREQQVEPEHVSSHTPENADTSDAVEDELTMKPSMEDEQTTGKPEDGASDGSTPAEETNNEVVQQHTDHDQTINCEDRVEKKQAENHILQPKNGITMNGHDKVGQSETRMTFLETITSG
ncbi:unnamed protein product [Clavelina lepadiformis]|uniref:Fibronectin type-III domain-containing protein n=1 Tax=Clavelina lepadiformis TaxID=159417 RepID=A0ABP0GB52_CLALP